MWIKWGLGAKDSYSLMQDCRISEGRIRNTISLSPQNAGTGENASVAIVLSWAQVPYVVNVISERLIWLQYVLGLCFLHVLGMPPYDCRHRVYSSLVNKKVLALSGSCWEELGFCVNMTRWKILQKNAD